MSIHPRRATAFSWTHHGRRALPLVALLSSCVGTTGGELVDFHAAAAGAAVAVGGQSLQFTSDRGWHVVLTKAKLHIGALYVNQSAPISGSQGTTCILPGTYVAQVTSGLDVDLLASSLQPFPTDGQGTTYPPGLEGQLWLTGGDINQPADQTPILVIAGTADQGGVPTPFQGTITIGQNRAASGAQVAGAAPICKQRIVSFPAPITVRPSGGLLLRIDPRILFVNVDFSQLTLSPQGVYSFSDVPDSPEYTQPSKNLFQNLTSAGALYTLSWSDNL